MKKLQLFDQNHLLSPLQKCQFCLLFKSIFILSKRACFLTGTSPNTFSGCILQKTKRSENFKFFTKTMNKNTYFVSFSNRCFCSWKRLLCYIKRRKSFFHDLFSPSMTWEYKGWQGVTGGDKGLQGVSKNYTNFFLTRTFPDTFT